uniref:Ion_trans domain-containing protein n=1 Tax=Angiostrongylus cantonensis TaxID=6313 RepID=A0A158P786_ANGCA
LVNLRSSCSESLQLLDFCYREDNSQTLKLLTAQLPHWGYQNCLSLAVMVNHKRFLAHPCCQRLLAELWHGSLRVRSGSNLRVLAALLCPPAALALAYKTSRVSSEIPTNIDDEVETPSLSAVAKMRAFYAAPITKFWLWCITFIIFLTLFSYVLLIETPINPTTIEYITLSYIVVYMVEHIRKVLEYLSAHPLLGPYIQMAAKMVVSMFYIIVLLLVTLMAFGVSRQAITYPHEKWNWLLVRNIFYKPYFMLYGEVYAGEIDTCGDEGDFICVKGDTFEGTNCVPGGWIPPVLMTIFLLVANILLINMLIAIFKCVSFS